MNEKEKKTMLFCLIGQDLDICCFHSNLSQQTADDKMITQRPFCLSKQFFLRSEITGYDLITVMTF